MPSYRKDLAKPCPAVNGLFARIMALLFFFAVLQQRAPAQSLDRSLIKRYNPSIVAKLYDLQRIVPLRASQQEAIAGRYALQDSLLAAWLIEGRPAEETDSLLKASQRFLTSVLDNGQVIAYLRGKNSEFPAIAAGAEFKFIKDTYDPDASYYPSVQNALNAKYGFVYQQYLLLGADKDRAQTAIANTAKVYDLYNLYPSLYSKRFAAEYIEKLLAIRKIPDTTLQNIKRFFYSRVQTDKFASWSQAIEDATQYYFPDTAVFSRLHRQEFERQSYELSQAETYNLTYMRRVGRNAFDSIYPLIREKNYKRAVLEYTYALYNHRLFDSLQRGTTKYYDSLIEATLVRNGSMLPSSEFAIALKYKDRLKLDPDIIDRLVEDAMYLAGQRDSILNRDPFAAMDFGPYEAQELGSLLTDEQFEMVLTFKNKSQAMADAQSDWSEMELRGLTGGFNKEETIDQLYGYYLRKNNAWKRLANDKIRQWSALRAISDSKPEALKLLDPIRWNGTTDKAPNNLKLKW
jgi:hypothetical protein